MEWQPIETAPKDGTEILLCEVVKWNQGTYDEQGKCMSIPRIDYIHHVAAYIDVEWFVAEKGAGYEYQAIIMENPTHWMPLPPPPANHQPRE